MYHIIEYKGAKILKKSERGFLVFYSQNLNFRAFPSGGLSAPNLFLSRKSSKKGFPLLSLTQKQIH
ncbi:hypothetical protein AR687_12585 [Flavobacteriaceae bacterium CRH]|nr:hypothetical protein AR687_12585 [Flavobacteriaceae bacterium CRH]